MLRWYNFTQRYQLEIASFGHIYHDLIKLWRSLLFIRKFISVQFASNHLLIELNHVWLNFSNVLYVLEFFEFILVLMKVLRCDFGEIRIHEWWIIQLTLITFAGADNSFLFEDFAELTSIVTYLDWWVIDYSPIELPFLRERFFVMNFGKTIVDPIISRRSDWDINPLFDFSQIRLFEFSVHSLWVWISMTDI